MPLWRVPLLAARGPLCLLLLMSLLSACRGGKHGTHGFDPKEAQIGGDGAGSDPSSGPSGAYLDTSHCPTPFMPVEMAQCAQEQAQGYGLSASAPAEWGFGGGTRTLWFGRLTCEDGTMPEVTRQGNIGPAPVPSSSPPSDTEGIGTLDILDLWIVRCPTGKTIEIYHNLYRCGSPCPPRGTRLIPADAYEAYMNSYAAREEGELEVALEYANAASELAPDFEVTLLWYALLTQEAGELERSLELYERVLALNPGDTFSVVQRARLLNALSRFPEALTLTTPLVRDLATDNPSYADALCAHATALHLSDADQARSFAVAACDAGAKECC